MHFRKNSNGAGISKKVVSSAKNHQVILFATTKVLPRTKKNCFQNSTF